MHPTRFALAILAVCVVFAGCVAPGGSTPPPEADSQSTDTPTPTATASPTPAGTTISRGVAVASESVRVTTNATESLSYRGQNVTVSHTESDDVRRVSITVGDDTLTVERRTSVAGESVERSWENHQFVVTPVAAVQRGDQTVFVAAETWNVATVRVEAFCRRNC